MNSETIPASFTKTVIHHRSRTALTFLRQGSVETELTFGRLHNEICLLASIFSERGVHQGSRVVIFIPKSIHTVVAHFATQSLGAISVPLNPDFTKSEVKYLLEDAAPELIICEPGKTKFLKDIYPTGNLYEVSTQTPYPDRGETPAVPATLPTIDCSTDDPALIIYTSGTTGNPKGAVLTHRNLLHDARNIKNTWDISSTDIICHSLPLFHVHGLCFALQTPLLAGARIHLLDSFNQQYVLGELSRKSGDFASSVFMAVPAMYTKLLDSCDNENIDFSHLRLITSGSAPLLAKEFERITRVFGQEPVEREGMSETGMNFSNPIHGKRIPGSIGLPLPGLQVRIVDPDSHNDVTEGDVGELWLKSESISALYWLKPEETLATWHDGWFRTGDLGRVDDNGYYYLTDRIKHIIISGGENVSAKEVETVIDSLEGVEESVVVGKADNQWGEVVVAAVKAKPDVLLTEEAVKSFCKQHLHTWKCPKKVLFVSDIPRNTMGKVLKEMVKKSF